MAPPPPPSQQAPAQSAAASRRLVVGVSSLTLDGPMGHILAVALDAATGREVSRATAPALSAAWHGPDDRPIARAALWAAVERACGGATGGGLASAVVVACCAALPTRDPPRDLADLERELASRLPSARVLAVQDGAAALAAAAAAADALPEGAARAAVAVVADEHVCAYGTAPPPDAPAAAAAGPACPHAQQQANKREVRVSGWRPGVGDGGSALDLGLRALAAACKATDGRGAPTSLVRELARHLGLNGGGGGEGGGDDARALADWAYGDGDCDGSSSSSPSSFQSRVCALAPVVDAACASGDAVAETILRHGVGELFRCVVVTAARLAAQPTTAAPATAPPAPAAAAAAAAPSPPASYRVVLAGALLRPGTCYAQLLAEALREHAPAAVVSHLPPRGVEPAVAAARMVLLPPLLSPPS